MIVFSVLIRLLFISNDEGDDANELGEGVGLLLLVLLLLLLLLLVMIIANDVAVVGGGDWLRLFLNDKEDEAIGLIFVDMVPEPRTDDDDDITRSSVEIFDKPPK